jgi:hypothetical protein
MEKPSWNNEDLFACRILHFATRSVATHIDVSSIGIKRVEHVTWLPRNRLSRRKFVGRR